MYIKIKIIPTEHVHCKGGNTENHVEYSSYGTWKIRVYGNYA